MSTTPKSRPLILKRILDIIAVVTTGLLMSPLLIIIPILIRLDSKGPILFRQERLGKDGAVFEMLKFRSMIENAEAMGTGLFSYEGDSRITRVGHYLRASSLDELPQLFNVLLGSMSFVGPRPPVTYELGDYKDFSEIMKIRFQMKPGITGLAQVSGRNDLDWDQKIAQDNRYIELFRKWNIVLDLGIIMKTIWVVVARKNVVEVEKSE